VKKLLQRGLLLFVVVPLWVVIIIEDDLLPESRTFPQPNYLKEFKDFWRNCPMPWR